MEIASGLIKLKPDSDEKVEEWRETVSSRLDEAIATLKDEGVEIESWFTGLGSRLKVSVCDTSNALVMDSALMYQSKKSCGE